MSLHTSFENFADLFWQNRSLTVAAPIGAARVSKRFPNTESNFERRCLG